MSDLIYRQDVLNLIPQDISDFGEGSCLAYDVGKLPSAQQWIPCSKMLPMDKGVYLITDDSGVVAWVEKAWFMWCDDGSPFWEYANVTAWMPLPEPYKEGNE